MTDHLTTSEAVVAASASAAPALGGVRAPLAHVETVAGAGVSGHIDGEARVARFCYPRGLAFDAAGTLYVADCDNHRVRTITPHGQVGTLMHAVDPGRPDGPVEPAPFNYPRGVAFDAAGNLYVADTDNQYIRKLTPAGVDTVHSGTGKGGFVNGARAVAQFYHPNDVAVDAAGYVYVADASNASVRKISPGGTASTLAGDGIAGYADGPGATARFGSPRGIVVDAAGTVFVVEYGNCRIRRITPAGVVSTFAGDGRGVHADGLGTAASFKNPCGIAIDGVGNLYIADADSHCIRRIDPDGLVTTIAGDGQGVADYADGPGPLARFNTPRSIVVGPDGAVYVADTMNHCIRRITLA